jgi:hypothetical protein
MVCGDVDSTSKIFYIRKGPVTWPEFLSNINSLTFSFE